MRYDGIRNLQFVFLLFTLLIISSLSLFGFSEKSYYFLKWNDETKLVDIGKFSSDFLCKKIIAGKLQPSDEGILDIISAKKNRPTKLVLIFHGVWGNWQPIQTSYLNSLSRLYSNSKVDVIFLSILWNTGGANYLCNWKKSISKAKGLERLILSLAQSFPSTDVFCHSMGNRFFEGLVSCGLFVKTFNNLTLFSPDLLDEMNSNEFIALKKSSKNIVLFIHEQDRILKIAEILSCKKRLGRTKNEYPNSKIEVVNMGEIDCDSMHHHTEYLCDELIVIWRSKLSLF